VKPGVRNFWITSTSEPASQKWFLKHHTHWSERQAPSRPHSPEEVARLACVGADTGDLFVEIGTKFDASPACRAGDQNTVSSEVGIVAEKTVLIGLRKSAAMNIRRRKRMYTFPWVRLARLEVSCEWKIYSHHTFDMHSSHTFIVSLPRPMYEAASMILYTLGGVKVPSVAVNNPDV
jgi:hypothetical protein